MVRHIIHVRLAQPYMGRQDYYFGSCKAIFQQLSAELLGATLRKLWAANVGRGEVFENDKCLVERVELLTQARNNKNDEL